MIILEDMLRSLLENEGSDIHIKVGNKPTFRIHGQLVDWGSEIVTEEIASQILSDLMNEEDIDTFERKKEADFGFGVHGIGRFRVNVFKQRGSNAVAIRAIPFTIKSVEELNLPKTLKDMSLVPRGLILVTGTVGSGKSTTIASMIEYINQNRRANIITIEDPIEFLYRDKNSLIHQREVGTDTDSYSGSLRYLLRQDPDVIMLGEIRDAESMYTALKIANTGHLVFSTLHTTDASQTIGRIISFFPGEQQNEIRNLLSTTLRGIISQRLIPTKDKKSRVPATEVLVSNEFVKDCIVDPAKTGDIKVAMEKGEVIYGMRTFDQSIFQLYNEGFISYDEALKNSTTPADFTRKVKGLEDDTENDFDFGDYNFSPENI